MIFSNSDDASSVSFSQGVVYGVKTLLAAVRQIPQQMHALRSGRWQVGVGFGIIAGPVGPVANFFERLGCGERMRAKGVNWHLGRVFFHDEQIYEFNLLPEAGHLNPAFVNLQQYYVEGFLAERAGGEDHGLGGEPPGGLDEQRHRGEILEHPPRHPLRDRGGREGGGGDDDLCELLYGC